MGAVELMQSLMAKGIEFEAVGGQIKWRSANSQITPESLAVLKDGKTDILNFLNADQDVYAFEERAAIYEYDGWFSHEEAEDMAAQCQGYDNMVALKTALKI